MTIYQFPAERLNEKGQCPVCKRKPTIYKRDRRKFCTGCDRAFDIETGEQIQNFAYQKIAPHMFERDCFDETELSEARGHFREVREMRLAQLKGETGPTSG
jgi:hypothetical protein